MVRRGAKPPMDAGLGLEQAERSMLDATSSTVDEVGHSEADG